MLWAGAAPGVGISVGEKRHPLLITGSNGGNVTAPHVCISNDRS